MPEEIDENLPSMEIKHLLTMSTGMWTDKETFVVRCQYLETAHHETIICNFKDDDLNLEFLSSFAQPGNPIFRVERRKLKGALVLDM